MARLLLERMTLYNERHSILDDFEETFHDIQDSDGILKAKIWYWKNVFKSLPKYLRFIICWRFNMLANHLKIAYRNFVNHKLFSFINVFGLAIGLTICLIISLWVQRELSYDRFHKNAHRIYRIERELFRDNLYSRWPITGGLYKQALIDDYPEIENAVRFWRREFSIKDKNNFIHRQGLFAVDNSIFEVFDFDLEEGNPEAALAEPMTAVLTRKNAVKYFGTDEVVGKSLTFEYQGEPTEFKITGILKEVPENSHIQFDMLMSMTTYSEDSFTGWRANYLYTYVLVSESTSESELETKLKTFVSRHLEPHYGDLLSQGLGIHEVLKMYLFPITDIHLHPSENWELRAGGNMASVYIFSSIAILILGIACINFMNLSTARANQRAKEVSLRKTIGAGKNQLRAQFLQESVLLAGISLLIALVLISLLIPTFNTIFGETLSVSLLFQVKSMIMVIGITFLIGILAGLYPAFYLTRFKPVAILKGSSISGSGKSHFRRNMVVLQFIISITLIIGMLTVFKQMRFIQNRSLGFDKENMVLISVRSQQVVKNVEAFRNALLSNTNILSVSASADVPSEKILSNISFITQQEADEPMSTYYIITDYDFIETYRMEVLSGREFSKAFATDTAGTIILNEAAVRRIGWSNEVAVGKELGYGIELRGKVVGVVKDFHYRSLHTEVEPLALLLNPFYLRDISIRIAPGDVRERLNFIRQTWEDMFPSEQFEYNFLDQRIDQLYTREQKMQSLFIVFSSLSVFVACLGLLGLAAFTAEVKTKEIGIRKTLGASVAGITFLLSKEFIKWIVIANVVAWPLAWYMMNKWLQNFAYKTHMGWIIFLFAGFITLLIAVSTFGFQTLKAATTNPVDTLRYE